jgi:hypothetical protein
MPWWQFKRWLDFWEINPWGDERADRRSAIVASIIANVNGNKTTELDFMPYTINRKESVPLDEQGWTDLKSMMIAMGTPKNIDH